MAEERKEVISVERNEHLPVLFQGRFPVVNDKATRSELACYTGLETMVSEKKVKYVVARKAVRKTWGWKGFKGEISFATALPRGTIIAFAYGTGSHSKAYHTYAALFIVTENKGDITLEDTTDGEDVVVHVENLRPIQRITEEEHARITALFMNKYGAKPSHYDPVTTLYFYWVERGLAQPPKPAPPPPPVEEGGEPFELSISAPAAAAVPAAPTAVETPPPSAAVAEAPPAPPAAPAAVGMEERPLVEEAKIELRKILAEQGYVVCRVVAFDLPSEYKGAMQEQVVEEGVVVERRRFAHDPKTLTLIRSWRRRFYELLHECAFRTPIGWILLAEPPKELQEAVEQLQKLAGGEYTVLEIPIPQLWVKGQAMAARERLAASLEEVTKTLADEAISATLRRRLERRKREIEAALSRLSMFLSALER